MDTFCRSHPAAQRWTIIEIRKLQTIYVLVDSWIRETCMEHVWINGVLAKGLLPLSTLSDVLNCKWCNSTPPSGYMNCKRYGHWKKDGCRQEVFPFKGGSTICHQMWHVHAVSNYFRGDCQVLLAQTSVMIKTENLLFIRNTQLPYFALLFERYAIKSIVWRYLGHSYCTPVSPTRHQSVVCFYSCVWFAGC